MNLEQANALWTKYKETYGLDSPVMIEEVAYDAPDNVEAFFDLIELLQGRVILHMTKRAHLYRPDFVLFIVIHEFTHLYDFLTCPFPVTEHEKLFLYMNAYSEYHACRLTLGYLLEDISYFNRDKERERKPEKTVYVNKNQIPAPFREISIRRLLEEGLFRTKIAYEEFYITTLPNLFVNSFRQLMYLYGYISLFENDIATLERTLRVLRIDDGNYLMLYDALKKVDVDNILFYAKECYDGGFLLFLRNFIRSNYDPSLYDAEELNSVTAETAQDFIDVLNERQAARETRSMAAIGRHTSVPNLEESPAAAFLRGAIDAARYSGQPDFFMETFEN